MTRSLSWRSLLGLPVGRSDPARWTDLGEILPEWDERTRMIAALLPANSRIIEFGAGRRTLEHYLPGGCTYLPSDLVDRGAGTLVCDLNREPRPDLRPLHVDTAVFGGVLEYMQNVESVIQWIARDIRYCVASYECARTRRTEPERSREVRERARIGWVNTFHEDELIQVFRQNGFSPVQRDVWETKDGPEPIFAFGKSGFRPDS